MRKVLVIMAVAVVFTACDEQKRDVQDTVFAPQVKALEKARAVEDKLKQSEGKNRAAVESSEKPGALEQE